MVPGPTGLDLLNFLHFHGHGLHLRMRRGEGIPKEPAVGAAMHPQKNGEPAGQRVAFTTAATCSMLALGSRLRLGLSCCRLLHEPCEGCQVLVSKGSPVLHEMGMVWWTWSGGGSACRRCRRAGRRLGPSSGTRPSAAGSGRCCGGHLAGSAWPVPSWPVSRLAARRAWRLACLAARRSLRRRSAAMASTRLPPLRAVMAGLPRPPVTAVTRVTAMASAGPTGAGRAASRLGNTHRHGHAPAPAADPQCETFANTVIDYREQLANQQGPMNIPTSGRATRPARPDGVRHRRCSRGIRTPSRTSASGSRSRPGRRVDGFYRQVASVYSALAAASNRPAVEACRRQQRAV